MFETLGGGSEQVVEAQILERDRKQRLAKARLSLVRAETAVGVLPAPLRAGSVWHVDSGNEALFAATLSLHKDGQWIGFVGVKNIGWRAAAEKGIALEKVIFIPEVKGRPLKVLAALIDGVDLVVAGPLSLSPQNQRALAGRARLRRSSVLTTVPWLSVSKPWYARSQNGGVDSSFDLIGRAV
ncbi:hypothetical protein [Gleimia europaea]|uniref:hypothetical protein n=1 Tax=Gleimia europaea TaxID=66228 RepID=UPI0012EA86AB|nr:hypothetical protein [Gleimia europaea]